MKAKRGCFFNIGAYAAAVLTPEKRPGTLCAEGRWAPGPIMENLVLTGIRSLDRPTLSKSLHRLRYPGPLKLRQWEEYRTECLE